MSVSQEPDYLRLAFVPVAQRGLGMNECTFHECDWVHIPGVVYARHLAYLHRVEATFTCFRHNARCGLLYRELVPISSEGVRTT
jgi:hypothetical protein